MNNMLTTELSTEVKVSTDADNSITSKSDITEIEINPSTKSNDNIDNSNSGFVDEIGGIGQNEEETESVKHITGVSNLDEMLTANAEAKGFSGDVNIISFDDKTDYRVIYCDSNNTSKKYYIILTKEFELVKMGETNKTLVSDLG